MLSLIVEVNSRLKLANCLLLLFNSNLALEAGIGHNEEGQLWGIGPISFEIVEGY